MLSALRTDEASMLKTLSKRKELALENEIAVLEEDISKLDKEVLHHEECIRTGEGDLEVKTRVAQNARSKKSRDLKIAECIQGKINCYQEIIDICEPAIEKIRNCSDPGYVEKYSHSAFDLERMIKNSRSGINDNSRTLKLIVSDDSEYEKAIRSADESIEVTKRCIIASKESLEATLKYRSSVISRCEELKRRLSGCRTGNREGSP